MEADKKKVEIWDAYYPDGTLAGADLIRGEKIPEEYRHAVSEIFVLHKDGTVLLMQRDFSKPNYPGYWESGAGGSVLKGESFEEGARRELREETGIISEKLTENYTVVTEDTIYKGYVCVTDVPKEGITLQEGETIAFKWVSQAEFLQFYKSDDYMGGQKKRLQNFVKILEESCEN